MKKKIMCAVSGKLFVVTGVLLLSGTIMGLAKSNQFVAKKTKKVSISSMQKECCQQLGDVLTELPELIKRIADVQQQVMSQVGSYMQGEKTGLWSADKKTLETSLETVQSFEKQLHAMDKQLNDFLLFLQQ